MKTTAVVLVALVAACGGEDAAPDPHFPQVSQLVGIDARGVDCHRIVDPVDEEWTATRGWCQWRCVYNGTVLFASLRSEFGRADSGAPWRVADSTWVAPADGDCPGMAR